MPLAPYYTDESVTLHHGDAREVMAALPTDSADCIVTSPPYYGLRDYGITGQYGHEVTVVDYVDNLRALFLEARRVLTPAGTMWLNLGDSYSGKANGAASETRGRARPTAMPTRINTTASAPYKSLLGVPWRVAFALIDDGWTLRNEVIWHKPNAMPEPVKDRLTARHETLFLFTQGPSYHFDLDPIREPLTHPEKTGHRFGGNNPDVGRRRGNVRTVDDDPAGRNPGDVWSISTSPFPEAHFACMPAQLAERCVLAGARPGGTVLDPFSGSGTTGLVAGRHGRRYVGIDLNAEYLDLSLRTRLAQTSLSDLGT